MWPNDVTRICIAGIVTFIADIMNIISFGFTYPSHGQDIYSRAGYLLCILVLADIISASLQLPAYIIALRVTRDPSLPTDERQENLGKTSVLVFVALPITIFTFGFNLGRFHFFIKHGLDLNYYFIFLLILTSVEIVILLMLGIFSLLYGYSHYHRTQIRNRYEYRHFGTDTNYPHVLNIRSSPYSLSTVAM